LKDEDFHGTGGAMARINISSAALETLHALSDADFEVIENAGKVELSVKGRSQIQAACDELARRAAVHRQRPPEAAVRKRLEELAATTAKLEVALNGLHVGDDASEAARVILNWVSRGNNTIDAFASSVNQFHGDVLVALQQELPGFTDSGPSRRGPERKLDPSPFFRRLASIYLAAGGKKLAAYKIPDSDQCMGSFLDFTMAVADALPKPLKKCLPTTRRVMCEAIMDWRKWAQPQDHPQIGT
jgi:hypothetical protein